MGLGVGEIRNRDDSFVILFPKGSEQLGQKAGVQDSSGNLALLTHNLFIFVQYTLLDTV